MTIGTVTIDLKHFTELERKAQEYNKLNFLESEAKNMPMRTKALLNMYQKLLEAHVAATQELAGLERKSWVTYNGQDDTVAMAELGRMWRFAKSLMRNG